MELTIWKMVVQSCFYIVQESNKRKEWWDWKSDYNIEIEVYFYRLTRVYHSMALEQIDRNLNLWPFYIFTMQLVSHKSIMRWQKLMITSTYFTKCVSSKLPQRLQIEWDFEPTTSPRLLCDWSPNCKTSERFYSQGNW